jgi:SPP1 gp7 family putative phage head morphogenesis protein
MIYHPAPGFWASSPKHQLLWAAYSVLERIERQLPAERRVRRRETRIRRIIERVVTEERLRRWWRAVNKQEEQELPEKELSAAVSAIVGALVQEIEELRIEAAEFVGKGLPPELKEQAIQEAFELVRNIPDTIREGLRDIMRETLAERRTQFDFAREVRKRWREFSKHRAEVIARTEWARVTGRAQLELYRQQGVKGKVWLTVGDARVCDKCNANAAEGPIPLEKEFPGGVLTVPQHPICRCSIAGAQL